MSIDLILNSRPRYYEFNESNEPGIRSGFIAQELRTVLNKIDDKSLIEHKSFRRNNEREIFYEDFIAHLVNTTQDLYSKVEELRKKIDILKEEIHG